MGYHVRKSLTIQFIRQLCAGLKPLRWLGGVALLWAGSASAQKASLNLIEETSRHAVYELLVDWGKDSQVPSQYTAQTTAITLPTMSWPQVQVTAAAFDELSEEPPPGVGREPAEIVGLGWSRKRPEATLVTRLVTYDSTTARLRRYRQMRVEVVYAQGAMAAQTKDNPHLSVTQSVLASGQFFRIKITQPGMYRIDREFLDRLPNLGVDPAAIDPDNIKVYGNGGAPVAALNGAKRIADLAQNQVFVQGGGDGSFDTDDAVWFYASGPSGWKSAQVRDIYFRPVLNSDGERRRFWQHYVHPFDTGNYYFIEIGSDASLQYLQADYVDDPTAELVEPVLGRHFVDLDEYLWGRERGYSGHTWVSQLILGGGPARPLLDDYRLPGLVDGDIQYEARLIIASNPAASVEFSAGSTTLHTANLGSSSSHPQLPIGRSGTAEFSQSVAQGQPVNLEMSLQNQIGGPQAALDWLRVLYPKRLEAGNGLVRFHTPLAETGTFTFRLHGFASAPYVLDITEPGQYTWLEAQAQGGIYQVQVSTLDADQPRELVAFVPTDVQAIDVTEACPAEEGCRVANQNLHGLQGFPDFLIITPVQFRSQAEELAAMRTEEGLRVEVVDVDQIYNEFSGGQRDFRGIRDYIKFVYDRAPDDASLLRYVLFFGDGHFDYRNLDPRTTFANHIPPYETEDSWDPETSYTTDDYFGLLDDNEGLWPYTRYDFDGSLDYLNERVDVGIGRFTVQSADDAQVVIDKIRHYESPASFGPWRNRYLFLADDGPTGQSGLQDDKDLHTQNIDVVAAAIQEVAPDINQKKIYALSYTREFLNEWRIPKARQDLLTGINSGMLIVNFSGHGGERTLMQENILTIDDARSLQNYDVLPIFITATCSFGRWDLGYEQSGAEELLTNPNGGAVALFTTVRSVYTSGNETTLNVGLNVALNRELFRRNTAGGLPPRLGDALRRTKNHRVGYEGNNRKFNLLGDPTMRVGLPAQRAHITQINDSAVEQTTGRLRALERISVQGEVRNASGTVDHDYTGTVVLAVYDALRNVPILPDMRRYMPRPYYQVREDLIWRGRAQVTAGRFTANFVVPKDIAYANEPGRISVYVSNESSQVQGFTENFTVGGVVPYATDDTDGPDIRLFLGDDTFTGGQLTPPNPTVVARLYDESGINTVGAGVGHEMLLVLDDNEQDAVNVGDLYEADENSFQSGSLRFMFEEPLSAGPHTLTLRAWDVLNNSGRASLDFEVSDLEELVIRNVLNYPNPTTGPTRFVFEHNQMPGTMVSVRTRIYTLSGRPVKTIEVEELLPAGAMQIEWDGLDDDYSRLSPGVYLYKVRVEVPGMESSQVAEVIEKLAIVR